MPGDVRRFTHRGRSRVPGRCPGSSGHQTWEVKMVGLYDGNERCDAAYSARLPSSLDKRIRAAAAEEGLSANEMRVICLRYGADTHAVVSRHVEWVRAAQRAYAVDLHGLVTMLLERGQEALARDMREREAKLARLHDSEKRKR